MGEQSENKWDTGLKWAFCLASTTTSSVLSITLTQGPLGIALVPYGLLPNTGDAEASSSQGRP